MYVFIVLSLPGEKISFPLVAVVSNRLVCSKKHLIHQYQIFALCSVVHTLFEFHLHFWRPPLFAKGPRLSNISYKCIWGHQSCSWKSIVLQTTNSVLKNNCQEHDAPALLAFFLLWTCECQEIYIFNACHTFFNLKVYFETKVPESLQGWLELHANVHFHQRTFSICSHGHNVPLRQKGFRI